MSGLWTPGGEHELPDEASEDAGPVGGDESVDSPLIDAEPADPDVAEELRRLRQQLAATPVADIVANHAVGMWQLAIVHLAPEDGPPNLEEAKLAIDATAALVEGLAGRLGEHEEPLRDALAQLRLVFVQVSQGTDDA